MLIGERNFLDTIDSEDIVFMYRKNIFMNVLVSLRTLNIKQKNMNSWKKNEIRDNKIIYKTSIRPAFILPKINV